VSKYRAVTPDGRITSARSGVADKMMAMNAAKQIKVFFTNVLRSIRWVFTQPINFRSKITVIWPYQSCPLFSSADRRRQQFANYAGIDKINQSRARAASAKLSNDYDFSHSLYKFHRIINRVSRTDNCAFNSTHQTVMNCVSKIRAERGRVKK
jgi:hypothetical protein